MNRLKIIVIFIFLWALFSGCSKDSSTFIDENGGNSNILIIEPSSRQLPLNAQQQYSAYSIDLNGESTDVTHQVLWSSSNSDIANIDAKGLVTANQVGDATIKAVLDKKSAKTTITVIGAYLTKIAITPQYIIFPKGLTTNFKASAYYSDNTPKDITRHATWKSDKTDTVDFSRCIEKGCATGIQKGGALVTAEFQGMQGHSSAYVTDSAVEKIDIFPSAIKLKKGEETLPTAQATLADKSTIDVTRQSLWSVKSPDIASVIASGNHAGNLTALKLGSTEFTATFKGVTPTTATITVTDPTLTSLEINTANSIYPIGSDIVYKAIAKYTDNSHLDVTASTYWQSSNKDTIDIIPTGQNAGNAKALKSGSSNITAQYEGKTDTTTTQVSLATLSGIIVEPANLKLPINIKQQYQAFGIYSDLSKRNITDQVTWDVDNNKVAAITTKGGLLTAEKVGTTKVTAALGTIKANTDITVADKQLISIYIDPPSTSEYIKGETSQLIAYGRYKLVDDINDYDITNVVTWKSDDPTIIGINSTNKKGEIQAVNSGHTEISIAYEGKTDALTLIVKEPALKEILLQPIDVTINIGEELTFSAQGLYSDGTLVDITRTVTWGSTQPTFATIDTYGIITPHSPGLTQISASQPETAIQAKTSLTVKNAPVDTFVVLPNQLTMGVGVSKPLTAKATFTDNTERNVTKETAWGSKASHIATVETSGIESGMVTGKKVGTTEVTAGFQGKLETVAITVIDREIDHILVSPENTETPQGIYTQYHATAVYTDKMEQDITDNVTWSVADRQYATVNHKGRVLSGMVSGTTDIMANFEGKTGQTKLTVNDARLVELYLLPDASNNFSFIVNEEKQLNANGLFSNNQMLNMTNNVIWVSSDTEVLSVIASGSEAGFARAHKAGSTPLTIYNQPYKKTASEQCLVEDSVLLSIEIEPANTLTIPKLNLVDYQAYANYQNGQRKPITADAFWESSEPAIADISQLGQAITKSEGDTIISVSYRNKKASVNLKVIDTVKITEIIIQPNNPQVKPLQHIWFKATAVFNDGTTLDITKTGRWSTSNAIVVSIQNGAGLDGRAYAGGAQGSSNIGMSYMGEYKETKMTVSW